MTYIEFAEKILGIELFDWQKAVLEAAQKCKDEGKDFYINTYAHQGKTLLNNCIQQKLGYDRGFEQAFEELKGLLRCRNYRGCVAGKGCDGICRIDSDICKSCENFGIPYLLLADWKKENEQLKNRCFVLTRGSLCSCCPIKCECRQVQFGNDKEVENDN